MNKELYLAKEKVWGHDIYLCGLRLGDGELLIVATSELPENAIKIYGLRWGIETLFGCLKGRGFNFEDTPVTEVRANQKNICLIGD